MLSEIHEVGSGAAWTWFRRMAAGCACACALLMLGPLGPWNQAWGYAGSENMQPAQPEELLFGSPHDSRVFRRSCLLCHLLPSPKMHTRGDWPVVVARMRVNMRNFGMKEISDDDAAAIVRFLQDAVAKIKH